MHGKRAVSAAELAGGLHLARRGFAGRISRWLQGVPSRAAVDRYLPDRRAAGASARSVIGWVKRQLVAFATSRAQAELAATLAACSPLDRKLAKAAAAAIEALRGMPLPQPLIGDAVERWLPARLVGVLTRRAFAPWPI